MRAILIRLVECPIIAPVVACPIIKGGVRRGNIFESLSPSVRNQAEQREPSAKVWGAR